MPFSALTAWPLGERRHALWWGSGALPLLRIAVELGYTFSGEDERRYWDPLGETLRVGALSEPWRARLADLSERRADQTRVRPGERPREDVEDSRHHTPGVGALRGQMRRQITVDDLLEAEPVDRADDEKVSDGENMVMKGKSVMNISTIRIARAAKVPRVVGCVPIAALICAAPA